MKYIVTAQITKIIRASDEEDARKTFNKQLKEDNRATVASLCDSIIATPVNSGPKQIECGCEKNVFVCSKHKDKKERCWASVSIEEGDIWCRNNALKNGYCKKHQYLAEK